MKDVISSSQKIKVDAPIAQWIEHQTSDLRVGGSSPPRRANLQVFSLIHNFVLDF